MQLLQTVALKAGELLLLTKEEDLGCPAGRRLWLLMKERSSLWAHLASWRPGLFYRVFLLQMDGSRPAQAPVLDTKQLVWRGSEQFKEAIKVDLCLLVFVCRFRGKASSALFSAPLAGLSGATAACQGLSIALPNEPEWKTLSLP